jgi:hypothetical protein
MSTTAVRTPEQFEDDLRRYLYERSEEGRAVRVGEKETSEQAAIVARYADLFTRAQLDALRDAEEVATADDAERLYRLRKTCEGGLIAAELTAQEDALENALLAARIDFKGEVMPLRTAQARLAVLPSYVDRDELGQLQVDESAQFNAQRLELMAAYEELEAELTGEPDPIARTEDEKSISLAELEAALIAATDETAGAYARLREVWFDKLLGPERDDQPTQHHTAYMRRLSPLDNVYTAERAVPVCLETLSRLGFDFDATPNIKLDLDDRPQKSPRACVIASDPPHVVHLITRSQGGLHDYQAFLHEAGHALHYGSIDVALPYAFRRLARDHALTEIYSYICEAITREPRWHAEHFGAEAAANAEATLFLEALLFRRYVGKLRYELGFWSRFGEVGGTPDGYVEHQLELTGIRYDARNFVADMDGGFYSADYLRAWIRSAQLRQHLIDEIGEDWWRDRRTGDVLRDLFAEGTRPTSEEIAARLGFAPFDTAPLVAELTAI